MKQIIASSILLLISTGVWAGPVDLSTWLIDGGGSWTILSDPNPNDSAYQSINGPPAMLFHNINSQGLELSGTIEVQTTTDDDFIGFVLGYDDNDNVGANATTDYILIDWKQGTQGGWGAGLAASRVTGSINTGCCDTGSNAWDHNGNISFIERAATLGTTGWANNTVYDFDITFTSTNIKVFIDSVLQFDLDDVFEDGSFDFYNYSQPGVRYAGITEDIVSPVSEPGTLGLLSLMLSGLLLTRRKKA
ncbi:MAG: PEP-CTERM sorting domain-containing protein [Gammaproteobacteria bacterium]|nr:PEP-CTERM sorting domain-containing protein [Gammaproteobacteria bacterium]